MKKWLDKWFAVKGSGIHKCPERWGKYITNDGAYFESNTFYHSSEYNVFFKRKKSTYHTCTPSMYKYQLFIWLQKADAEQVACLRFFTQALSLQLILTEIVSGISAIVIKTKTFLGAKYFPIC